MFLNSIPQTPNLILCTLQKAIQKKETNKKKETKKKRKKRKTKRKRKEMTTLHDQENVAQTHWQDDVSYKRRKNIQETILLQPFIEKNIYN